jgi:RNA polymerase sigma factor (sigma-70 family)
MNVVATPGSGLPAALDFEGLVGEYYEILRRFALRLARNSDTAADLTQQTFYLALKHQGSLRDPGSIRSWLHTILHREFLQRMRGDRRHPTQPLEDSETALPDLRPQQLEDLDASLVMKGLLRLEERFRLPLAMFYLEELSYREIAGRLGIPVGTVMSRLSRARQMLRLQLEPAADGSPSRSRTESGGSRKLSPANQFPP